MDLKLKIFDALSSYNIKDTYLEKIIDACEAAQADHRTTIEALKMSGTALKEAQQKIAALELQIKDLDHLLGNEFERTEALKDILLNGIKEAVKVI